MKRILVIAMTLALCMTMAAQNQTKSKGSKMSGNDDVSSKLQEIEKKWAAAGVSSDCESVSPYLADNWMSTDADGKMHTKAEMLQDCNATKGKTTSSEVSDMKVNMVNSNTAVVTGKWTGAGTGMNGKPIGAPERWTDTFVKEGGQWKCVASQSTRIASDQSQTAQQ